MTLQQRTTPSILRKKYRGAILPLFCMIAVLIVAFMGIAIYTGLHVYATNELTKTAQTAALAGARMLYPGFDEGGMPIPDTGSAESEASAMVASAISNTGVLQSMSPSFGVSSSLGDQSVTVEMKGKFPTPVLGLIGINEIEISSVGKARALKYAPTYAGPIVINPSGGDPATFEKYLDLDFPMLSNDSSVAPYEVFIKQGATAFMGYQFQGCNGRDCHAMQAAGIEKLTELPYGQPKGEVVYGEALYDLSISGINKSSAIKLVDDAVFDSFKDGQHILDSNPLVIDEINILGFSAVCPVSGCAGVQPVGFLPVL